MMTGDMLVSGRLPGASAFFASGRGSNHMMPLFSNMPVDGDVTLEPKMDNRVWVTARVSGR